MSYRQTLDAFRRADGLALEVYAATDRFPRGADPRLVARMRTDATAVAGRILEGRTGAHPPAGCWQQALDGLDRIGRDLGRAETAGWIGVDGVLSLLEALSGVAVQLQVMIANLRRPAATSIPTSHRAGRAA